MFGIKVAMEALPNIQPVGMMVMTFTIVYRRKALYPLYVFVLLNGLYAGFAMWWIPYLYLWTILWAVTMLLPKNMPKKISAFVYPVVCGLHGLLFGVLYAPAQAIMYGLDFKQMMAWIAAGLPFDAIHAAGNLAMGFLIIPFAKLLKEINRKII